MTPEQKKAYLRGIQEKIRLKKEEEERQDQLYYEEITSGKKLIFFIAQALFCLLFSLLMTVDIYLDGVTEPVPVGPYQEDGVTHERINAAVWVQGEIFTPYYKDYVSVDYESFSITKSTFFNTGKYISFDAHTLGERERFNAWKRHSIYDVFPLFQILLIIPFLVLLLKRPHPLFVFMRRACIYLIFPGSILLLVLLMV